MTSERIIFCPRPAETENVEGLTEALPIEMLAREPSLHSMTPADVLDHGGPLAQQIVKAIYASETFYPRISSAEEQGLFATVDVRVQRLMPGMFPSIPGWHCDAVPRADYHDQPDFAKVNPHAVHFTCIVSTDESGVSATEFLAEQFVADFESGRPVWQQLHEQMAQKAGTFKTDRVRNGQIRMFETLEPHRTMPATTRGWRMFFRLSYSHIKPLKGGIASQQQVYLVSEGGGW